MQSKIRCHVGRTHRGSENLQQGGGLCRTRREHKAVDCRRHGNPFAAPLSPSTFPHPFQLDQRLGFHTTFLCLQRIAMLQAYVRLVYVWVLALEMMYDPKLDSIECRGSQAS